MKRRHRHTYHSVRPAFSYGALLRPVIGTLVVASLLFYSGKWILNFFGINSDVARTAVLLQPEDRGVVNVSLDGGPFKRTESDLKLYEGDEVETRPSSFASLTFMDGTFLRLQENTHIRIVKSSRGDEAKITVALDQGSVWVNTPTKEQYSGSILRTVNAPGMTFALPSRTEGIIGTQSITLFSADGQGVAVHVDDADDAVIIGEGQMFTLPSSGEWTGDLYAFRSALDPTVVLSPFVEESKVIHAESSAAVMAPPSQNVNGDEKALTVSAPEQNTVTNEATIVVAGSVGKDVAAVHINGYDASIDPVTRTFELQLALADADEVTISIEALDSNGILITEARRTIARNRKPPEPPTITSPATEGSTYATNRDNFEIRGTAPAGAVGILVNDYRLQLFSPGDRTWSYLASSKLGNLVGGTNTFDVIAINAGGYRSDPVRLTIVFGEGDEGVIAVQPTSTGTTAQQSSKAVVEEEIDPATLPANKPLLPGSLQIHAPTSGQEYTTSEREFLIEGNTSPETSSVWVNDYRLRLYERGKNFWNYIASVDLGTMKRGRQTYKIVTRDEQNRILDTMEYVVIFNP